MRLTIALSRNLDTLRAGELETVDILAFPELFNCVFDERTFEITTRTADILIRLREISSNHPGLMIIGGSLPSNPAGENGPYNESSILHRGEIIHRVTKIHQFKPYREHELFTPGEYAGLATVGLRGGTLLVGTIICYDLRFPELARRLAIDGMDILFVPAIWSVERDIAWRTLLAARAIENQVFSIGINSSGRSYCFSPTGESRYESDDVMDFAKFDIDTVEISELKRFVNTVEDSRLRSE